MSDGSEQFMEVLRPQQYYYENIKLYIVYEFVPTSLVCVFAMTCLMFCTYLF